MDNSYVASAFALLFSRTLFAPLERAKLLLQTAGASTLPKAERYLSLAHYLASVPGREGFNVYWRGHFSNLTKMGVSTVVKFGNYSFLTAFSKPKSGFDNMLIGAVAGLGSVIATYPLDLARTKITTELTRKGMERQYSGTINCLIQSSMGGIKGLFKGVKVSAAGSVPFSAISFALHEELLLHLPGKSYSSPYSKILEFYGASSLAVLFAQTVCYPLDTLRRRLQVSGSCQYATAWSATEVAELIWNTEGARGFYRGCFVNCLKSAPCIAVQFTIYDWMRDYIIRPE